MTSSASRSKKCPPSAKPSRPFSMMRKNGSSALKSSRSVIVVRRAPLPTTAGSRSPPAGGAKPGHAPASTLRLLNRIERVAVWVPEGEHRRHVRPPHNLAVDVDVGRAEGGVGGVGISDRQPNTGVHCRGLPRRGRCQSDGGGRTRGRNLHPAHSRAERGV